MEKINRKLKVSNLKGVTNGNLKYYCSWLTLCGVLYVNGANRLYELCRNAGIKYFQYGKGTEQDFLDAVYNGVVSAIRYCCIDSHRCFTEWNSVGMRKYGKYVSELSKLL